MRRAFLRTGLALSASTLLAGCGRTALPWQSPAKLPRIGWLGLSAVDDRLDAFREGLRELGYAEGQNVVIEARWAESPEQFPAIAAELVRLPVDLIVTAAGSPSVRAAMDATETIPIVFTGSGDPIQAGFVDSLARPGGNVTGLSLLSRQMHGKRLQLLRDIVPRLARLMLLTDTVAAEATGGHQEVKEAAQALGVQISIPDIRGPAEVAAALASAGPEGAEALWVTGHALITRERTRIAEFATNARLPLLAEDRVFPAAGGLVSYGPNRLAMYRRAATFVGKILKGTPPGEIPVEQPSAFDLVLNLKTAEIIGVSIPPAVLQQATEIIR